MVENLQREASCSICLGLFQDPVSIPCGHNFCRRCIERCWEGLEGPFPCPQCRQPGGHQDFRPSRELANIAQIARKIHQEKGGGGNHNFCRHHHEVLQLFCKEDLELLCVVCEKSRAHRSHPVLPVEEAAQEYKEEIQSCLRALKEEREKYLEKQKTRVWKNSYLEKTQTEGRKIARGFQELHQFLRDQEFLLLSQLSDVDGAISKLQEEAVSQVLEEMSQLDTLVWEMEGKFQQPPGRFLQDIRKLLESCEKLKFNPPAEISPALESKLEELVQKNGVVRGTLRRCQDSLMFQLHQPANITLDPTTAHPNLHLSQDLKEAKGHLSQLDLQDNPGRFDFEPCVLAREGFTSGRHFWEVEVGQGGVWALGVARGSVKRKGPLSFTPKEGVWALETFHSLTSPRANRRLSSLPRRLRVSLDYEGGRVGFFSPEEEVPILVYTRASFKGEKVFPWFKMGLGARLQEITQNPTPEDHGGAGQVRSPLDWVGFGFPLRICS